MFLNTKGTEDDISPELKRFLDFVGKNEMSEDSFIKTLDGKMKEAKANTEWRREYMKLLMIEEEKFSEERNLGREEGITEGEQRAQRSIYEKLVSSGKLSPQEASIITRWSLSTDI